jgi:signal transduction histidine kinase
MLVKKFYDYRHLLSLGSLLILAYCSLYAWQFIPYPAFTFNWRPDRQLQVAQIEPDSIAAAHLQIGDKILAVDGLPVHRTAIFHPPQARKSVYQLTIEREGEILERSVPYLTKPDNYAYSSRLTMGAVTFAIWLIGVLTLYYAHRKHTQAIRFGLICLASATILMSWTASLMGVPYVWLIGQPLSYLLAVGWLYLGQLPHYAPFSNRKYRVFLAAAIGAAFFTILSIGEGLWLFPHGTSIQELTGISLYQLSAVAQIVGGIAIFSGFTFRRIGVKNDYLKQQLNILIFFDLLGALPAVFLTFLPLALWGNPILPVPLAAVGSTAILQGLFYVLLRDTYHEFDVGFGRFSQSVVLFLVFLLLYGFLLRGLSDWLGERAGVIEISLLLFAAALIIAPKLSSWISDWMHNLLFGDDSQIRHAMSDLAGQLHRSPTSPMLSHTAQTFAELLSIPQSVVALSKENDLRLAVQTGSVTLSQQTKTVHLPLETIHRQQVAIADPPPILSKHPWADVAIPLQLYDQSLIGVWLLAKPTDGFFTHRSLQLAEQAANALAVGIDMITLLDSADELNQRIAVEEREKQDFAALLHDKPIQKLTAIRSMMGDLERLAIKRANPLADYLITISNDLSELEQGLRGIYEGTYQSALMEGLATTVRYQIDSFQAAHPIKVDFYTENLTQMESRISETNARTIFFVLQEALNNIAKHSGASAVEIALTSTPTAFQMTVNDNGRFQPKSRLSETDLQREKHFGIASIKRRTAYDGGKLDISQNEQGGTKLYLELSL